MLNDDLCKSVMLVKNLHEPSLMKQNILLNLIQFLYSHTFLMDLIMSPNQ